MKGKGQVKVHIIARKSTNTGFKKMIGNALRSKLNLYDVLFAVANKTKGVFAIQTEKSEKFELQRHTTTQNAFDNIKENLLNQKSRLKVMLSLKNNETEDNLEQKKLEGKGTADMKEIDDDFDDEEDIPILKYNPFTLRLNMTSNKYKKEELEDQINKNNRLFSLGTIVCLLMVHLMLTAIFIAVQADYPNEFSGAAAIIALRFVFAAVLFVVVVFDKRFIKKRIKGKVGFGVFIFGLIVSVIHAHFTNRDAYEIIQAIEFMFIYAIGVNAG